MLSAAWLTALAICTAGTGRALAPTRTVRAVAPRYAARWPDAAPRDGRGATQESAPLITAAAITTRPRPRDADASDSRLDPAVAEAACGPSVTPATIVSTFAITAAGPSAALASLTPDEEIAARVFAEAGEEAAMGRKEVAAALVLPLLAYKVSSLLNRTPLMVSLDATIALATLAALKVWFLEG